MIRNLFVTDLHLKMREPYSKVEGNLNTRTMYKINKLKEIFQEAIELGTENFFILGDIYDAPNPSDSLRAEFAQALLIPINSNARVFIIVGNHSRTANSHAFEIEARLAPGIQVISEFQVLSKDIDGIDCIAVPFGSEQMFLDFIKDSVDGCIESNFPLIVGHNNIEGGKFSKSNKYFIDLILPNTIPRSALQHFKVGCFGHIHLKQEILPNIHYIGATFVKDISERDYDPCYCYILNENNEYTFEWHDVNEWKYTVINYDFISKFKDFDGVIVVKVPHDFPVHKTEELYKSLPNAKFIEIKRLSKEPLIESKKSNLLMSPEEAIEQIAKDQNKPYLIQFGKQIYSEVGE